MSEDSAPAVRQFTTGANRDRVEGKLALTSFEHPLVTEAFGEYMNFNRTLGDGSMREPDNWQKGIPIAVYRDSLRRHAHDVEKWLAREFEADKGIIIPPSAYRFKENIVWMICGSMFNLQGLLLELIKRDPELVERCKAEMVAARAKIFAAKGITPTDPEQARAVFALKQAA